MMISSLMCVISRWNTCKDMSPVYLLCLRWAIAHAQNRATDRARSLQIFGHFQHPYGCTVTIEIKARPKSDGDLDCWSRCDGLPSSVPRELLPSSKYLSGELFKRLSKFPSLHMLAIEQISNTRTEIQTLLNTSLANYIYIHTQDSTPMSTSTGASIALSSSFG